jgi:hypothetical protein
LSGVASDNLVENLAIARVGWQEEWLREGTVKLFGPAQRLMLKAGFFIRSQNGTYFTKYLSNTKIIATIPVT